MARMSIDIPTILKKIKPKTGTLRRTSTGNTSINVKEPNYPRVSTGSCHDICKYDIKRTFPVKPWRPVGRILDKNVNVSLHNNHRGIKAIKSPKVMSSVSSRQHHSELSKPKGSKTAAFSRILDKDHRGKSALLTSPKVISVSSSIKPKTSKADTFSHQPAPKQPIRRTLLTGASSDKRESQNDAAGNKVKKPKTSKTDTFSHQPAPKQPIRRTLLTGASSDKRESQNDAAGNKVKKPKTSKTDTFSLQPAPKQPIRRLLTASSSDKRESQIDAGNKVRKPTKINSPRLSFRKLPTVKSRTGNNISLQKNDSQQAIKNNTCSSGDVPEKVIHVIEPGDDQCRSKSPVQESSNCTEFTTLIGLNRESSNNRKRATEGAERVVIIPEENNSTPKKMKLDIGKVPVVENAINAVDRSLRIPVSEGKVNHTKNDSIGGGVLRHQCVGLKNRDLVLLNIVIEERASNLVRMMRKTKVEALVGAFESVISKTQDC